MMRTILALAVATVALTGAAQAQMGKPGAHFIEMWDQDGDGVVTLEEAQARRGDLFTTFDADGDGALVSDELAAMDAMRTEEQADMREEMDDMSGKGMGKGMGQGMGQSMMGAGGGMMQEALDADGDGKISRDEFVGGSAEWFAMMDRNGDGKLTEDDFGR